MFSTQWNWLFNCHIFKAVFIVKISASAKYDLSTFSVRRNVFKFTVFRSPELCGENEKQFESAEAIKHANNLQYRAFSITLMEKIWEQSWYGWWNIVSKYVKSEIISRNSSTARVAYSTVQNHTHNFWNGRILSVFTASRCVLFVFGNARRNIWWGS